MKSPSQSIDNILDTHVFSGAEADESAAPDLLIEVPHGATKGDDFRELAEQLDGPFPGDLRDFFYVNTDVGAFEVAREAAREFTAANPGRKALVLRCRIPRTFIDCNRRIELDSESFKQGGVTPGLMPWVNSASDLSLLRQRYETYISAVKEAREGLSPTGAMILLHTYAPRSVGVEVDENIVENLRRAYEPKQQEKWPLRPAFDVICHDLDGNDHGPRPVIDAFRQGIAELDWSVEESATYPLHPSTMAWDHVMALPGRALCVEVRRDLLADPFDPFVEMNICPHKVAPIAAALANSLNHWWSS